MAIVILGGLVTSTTLNLLVRFPRWRCVMAGLASKRGNRTMLDMRCFAIENLRELLFRVSVSLKGLDAVLEIIGSTLLWAFGPGSIVNMVAFLTQDELREDPHDPVSNFAVKAATHLSVGTEHFVAFDLLCDGLIKVLLVAALLRHKLWAYPAAMIVFGLFIAYQIYRFTFTHGIGLLVLSGFDVFLIGLIGLEYQALKRRGH